MGNADETQSFQSPISGNGDRAKSTGPESIGPYRLIECLGEGGMGTVFKANQQWPVKRTVAIKLIKPGFDSAEVIARFESERQALARMDHPNIARVLDAGTDERGRPYFVMEYVPGTPITKYADDNRLSIKQRLELVLQVCDAIGHAHAKAIIHRDIKASNVLAHSTPEGPRVKVIDFGVAKALTSDRLTDRTFNTARGQAIGTYESMSPEQAEGSPDIDTRTDVYAIGCLLYELLSGSKPFDKSNLAKAADHEIRRIIREEEPPRPSTQLSTMGDTATRIAKARQVELDALTRQLKSELDWIPLMALRKERERRYGTPQQMAEDIQNYLDGKPLTAAPSSAGYRIRKFIRRNRSSVVSGLAVLLFFLLGMGGMAWALVAQARLADSKLARLLQDAEKAETERRDELERQKTAANDHFRNATFAEQRGNWTVASEEYAAAEKGGYPDRLALAVGHLRALDRSGRAKDAESLIVSVRETMPDVASSAEFELVQGFFYWSSKPNESVVAVRKALAHGDQLIHGDQAFGEALVTDDPHVVSVKLQLAVESDPFNRDARALLSLTDLLLGDATKAEKDSLQLIDLYPDDSAAPLLASFAAEFEGRHPDAIAYLARDEKLPAEMKEAMSDVLAFVGKNRCLEGVASASNPLELLRLVGKIQECAAHFTPERSLPTPIAFKKFAALFNFPSMVRIRFSTGGDMFEVLGATLPMGLGEYFLGNAAVKRQDYAQAIQHYENAISAPSLVDCRRESSVGRALARWMMEYGHRPDADVKRDIGRDLDQTVAFGGICPDVLPTDALVMEAGCTLKEYTQIRTLALMWMARFPDDPSAKYYLAWADSNLGHRQTAIALYQEALNDKTLPDNLRARAKVALLQLTAPPSTAPTTQP